MTNYLLNSVVSRNQTPQSEAIPGSNQVANSAGGYSFPVSDKTRLQRFLILGSQGGSYYAKEQDLTKENTEALVREIKRDGVGVVSEILKISQEGRAVKNDPALFVLALVFTHGTVQAKYQASVTLPKVARTGTHLLHFVAYLDALRGWGSVVRQAVSAWYLNQPAEKLAYQVTKYANRDGWTHTDVLRLAHPKPLRGDTDFVFDYITKVQTGKREATYMDGAAATDYLMAVEAAKKVSETQLIRLIQDYSLPMEVIPTEKRTAKVYEALLPGAPITWLIRNLGTLSKLGVIKTGQYSNLELVTNKLTDEHLLKQGRVHPLSVLVALNTYESGKGFRGSSEWPVIGAVTEALAAAYYKSFKTTEPTGLRYVNALDVSSSMGSPVIAGMPGISPKVGSGAMAMATKRIEDKCVTIGFTSDGHNYYDTGITELDIRKTDKLSDVQRKISNLQFGGTDCALPMIWAKKNRVEADVFVVYTDNETWAGSIHPSQALRDYRQAMGIPAKLVVVGMVSNGFTIADPKDSGMLDMVGFDSSAPQAIAQFAKGF